FGSVPAASIPAEGNLIKREWLKTYRTPPQLQPGDIFVISWDTAMKASEIADYSVGTVWHVQGDNCYLLDLIRNRFDFPDLKRAVMKQKEHALDGRFGDVLPFTRS